MANSNSWLKIFQDYKILEHNFDEKPFYLSADQIKQSCKQFEKTSEKEVRTLCKQDRRQDRPQVFKDNNLFILPVHNGQFAIVKGEGYIDIPAIKGKPIVYTSKLDFHLDTSEVGDSEMQHLDMAYASSLIRTFMNDDSLLLTIRGRKYTPSFSFKVNNQQINVQSVQTEVDAGYEGRTQIVLVEAKNTKPTNTIIRQLFYPYRQWKSYTNKDVKLLFFERNKKNNLFNIWEFEFKDDNDYNSIKLVKSESFILEGPNTI